MPGEYEYLKILLVDPPQLFLRAAGQTRYVQPLGLAYVAAALNPHHEVAMLLPDTRAYTGNQPWECLQQAIVDFAPEVLGFTAVTATFPAAQTLAKLARQALPELVTVIGGTHASADPLGCLGSASAFDYLVAGEGERTMLDLVNQLEDLGKRFDPHKVPGLAWRDSATGAIVRSTPRPPEPDLDNIAFPDRTNLLWPDQLHPTFYQSIITLRGCPYRCIYCAVPSSEGKRTRFRSAANVADEIELLVAQHQIPGFFFHDSVFTLNKRRAAALCNELIQRRVNLPFYCQTRTDRLDDEMADLLREAGCEQIFFGIESGDVESLTRIRKRTSLEEVEGAVQRVKSRGIRCTGFFMVGYPWETESLIKKTVDFATSIDLDAISLFSATPLPGTELWDITDSSQLPESIDFTTPQVNLTRLSDAAYKRAYAQAQHRVHQYNLQHMREGLAGTSSNWLNVGDG